MQTKREEDQEPLLDKKEAAKRLGVSRHSINRLMYDIGYVRIGKRRVLFRMSAIEEYIRRRSVPARQNRQTD